jgi:hypothetical protein
MSLSLEELLAKNLSIQIKEELEWYLRFVLRNNVRSMLNFGVERGGTELLIAQRYQKLGRPLALTGIDFLPIEFTHEHNQTIIDNFDLVTYNYIQADLRNLPKYLTLGRYDLVFVDADHTYDSVKADYELALRHARRFIAFHDIVDSPFCRSVGCYVSQLWNELKQEYKETWEITQMAGDERGQFGIGIIKLY